MLIFQFVSQRSPRTCLLSIFSCSADFVVQSPSQGLTLCDPMDSSMPDLPVAHHLLEFSQVHVHCIGDAIQPSHPLTPSSPSALNLSQYQGLFQCVICLHQMTGCKNTGSFSISPSSEYSGLISFKSFDWFDLLAIQGIFRSLLQHHSSKGSILWCSVFFIVQLSQPLSDHWEVLQTRYLYSLCFARKKKICFCSPSHEFFLS